MRMQRSKSRKRGSMRWNFGLQQKFVSFTPDRCCWGETSDMSNPEPVMVYKKKQQKKKNTQVQLAYIRWLLIN